MENLLNKEAVKRVQEFIKKFDSKLEILVLDTRKLMEHFIYIKQIILRRREVSGLVIYFHI